MAVTKEFACPAETFTHENRLIFIFLGLHFLACGIIAAMTDTWLFYLSIGAPAVLFPAWLVQQYPAALLSRLAASAACMAFVLLGVQQTGGYMEAHFSFFVMITVLAVYRDWKILIFASVLVIIHHVGFTIFDPRAIGFYVWNDAFGAWRHVISHLSVGLIQVFALCFLTIMLRKREALNAELGSSLDRAKYQAERDPLTGLFNRHYLQDYVARLQMQMRNSSMKVAICVIDVDHFKTVNDRYGHAAGDDVLCAIAETIRGEIRLGDCAVRHGGEEFLVALPQSNIEDGVHFAERIRAHVAALVIATSRSTITVTVSIGVAAAQPEDSFEEILQRADETLYLAKNRGRNRVEAWSGLRIWQTENTSVLRDINDVAATARCTAVADAAAIR